MDHLSPNIFGKKIEKSNPREVRPRDGHVEHACKFLIILFIGMTAWTFELLCVKISKIPYFLQMTWF